MRRRLLAGCILVAAAGMLVVSAACGSSTSKEPTPVTTFKITPAATRAASATPAAVPTVTAAPAAAATGTAVTTRAAGTTLTVVGKDIAFDKTTLQAKAGAVTIMFDNQDGGVQHDFHVFRGTNASGESVGTTKIETGPVKQTLTLTLAPGAYFYQCDVHPTQMEGTLTVS